MSTMRSLGSHCSMCVFKTYVNAWTTSRRFHEAALASCISGCSEEDNLAHYLVCNRLWNSVGPAVGVPVGATILERLGIADSPKQRMRELAIAYTFSTPLNMVSSGCHKKQKTPGTLKILHWLLSRLRARTPLVSVGVISD